MANAAASAASARAKCWWRRRGRGGSPWHNASRQRSRAPGGGQANEQPACRPRSGGRWLTGFKDLWLTGPLTAPKGQEIWAFGRGRPCQGIVKTINWSVDLARAGLERARRDVEVLADHRRAGAVAAVRHRRERPPRVRLRIVGLVVREGVGRQARRPAPRSALDSAPRQARCAPSAAADRPTRCRSSDRRCRARRRGLPDW